MLARYSNVLLRKDHNALQQSRIRTATPPVAVIMLMLVNRGAVGAKIFRHVGHNPPTRRIPLFFTKQQVLMYILAYACPYDVANFATRPSTVACPLIWSSGISK